MMMLQPSAYNHFIQATGFFLYCGTKKERDPQRERHKWIEMTKKGRREKS